MVTSSSSIKTSLLGINTKRFAIQYRTHFRKNQNNDGVFHSRAFEEELHRRPVVLTSTTRTSLGNAERSSYATFFQIILSAHCVLSCPDGYNKTLSQATNADSTFCDVSRTQSRDIELISLSIGIALSHFNTGHIIGLEKNDACATVRNLAYDHKNVVMICGSISAT